MFLLVLLLASWCVGALTETKPYYDLNKAHIFFEEFVNKYDKKYSSVHEKRHRFDIFIANLENLNKLNKDGIGAVFGINQFMDITDEEFSNRYTGFRTTDKNKDIDCEEQTDQNVPVDNATDSFDWREKNAVTHVKDQGNCGSCWAFSSVGVLEGQYAIKHKELLELSEQEILDCDQISDACCGGTMSNAFKALIAKGGIIAEKDYPYIKNRHMCRVNASLVVATVNKCNVWEIQSQEKIKQLLFHYGPIAIALKADALRDYYKGILMDSQCTGDVNHAVLLVGYGTENGQDYWIIKNSWATTFGESGYFRLERGEKKSSCGMTMLTTAELGP